mmetsp:Transcript_149275/g.388282  ORF Transcript_149275/g.388282 Transcript_149275/m.388282 type:complete len:239 (+) Transcript_149275:739-1455(+)
MGKIGIPSMSLQSAATTQRNKVKKDLGNDRKASAPKPDSWMFPNVSRKKRAIAYRGIAITTVDQSSVRIPPRVPRIMTTKSQKISRRAKRMILLMRNNLTMRARDIKLAPSLKVCMVKVNTTSSAASRTKKNSNQCHCESSPVAQSRRPYTVILKRTSTANSNKNSTSTQIQPCQTMSQLIPIRMVFMRTMTPMTDSKTSNDCWHMRWQKLPCSVWWAAYVSARAASTTDDKNAPLGF